MVGLGESSARPLVDPDGGRLAGADSASRRHAGRDDRVSEHDGEDVIDYFKRMAVETGLPYQSLINLYLRDCVLNQRRLAMTWEEPG